MCDCNHPWRFHCSAGCICIVGALEQPPGQWCACPLDNPEELPW